jgi:hypothetical protein
VVGASNAVVFNAPERQGSAAMGTMEPEQREMALAVTEEREIFREEPHWNRSAPWRHLFGEAYRPPVAAQQRPRGRAGADSREPIVLFSGDPLQPLPPGHLA